MGMHEQLEIYLKCFNRYMVECEWDLSGKKAAYIAVLIDTWWNVN